MEYAKLSDLVKMKTVSETPTKGVFEVEGLFAGYGITIGNALRRVLLSSLPGAAITQVKIIGVKHEFSTIEGILEDVLEITLNLKKTRFKFYASEPQVLTLEAKGEKKVKAGDIKTNAQVEIVNPDAHIATLTDKKSELKMEITVEKGLGYSSVEARKAEKLSVGVLAIDAIFTPVTNVNFVVENMRLGEKTDYNRLRFFIDTDGTILPSAAFHKSVNILKDHFDKIALTLEPEEQKEEIKEEKETEKKKAAKKNKKEKE